MRTEETLTSTNTRPLQRYYMNSESAWYCSILSARIHDNHCDLTITSNTGQHSQFLQCLNNSATNSENSGHFDIETQRVSYEQWQRKVTWRSDACTPLLCHNSTLLFSIRQDQDNNNNWMDEFEESKYNHNYISSWHAPPRVRGERERLFGS